jgi:hypothetical protein
MDFEDAKVAIEIFSKYTCGQNRDWGNEENRKIPIGGCFEFGHDQCWVSLPRTTDEPDLTPDEIKRLEDAGWFIDDDAGGWSHF